MKEFSLSLGQLTDDEREIILRVVIIGMKDWYKKYLQIVAYYN